MKNIVWSAVVALALLPSTARADLVSDWNQKAFEILQAERVGGGVEPVRVLSMMHIAMADAVDACEKKYSFYVQGMADAPGGSSEAAAHSAARRVLVSLFPRQQPDLDATFEAGIAKLAAGPAIAAGVAAGENASRLVLAARKDDGFGKPNTFRPITTPGSYVPTGLGVNSDAGDSKPFALQKPSQFRPGPPPALTSATYARDYNELKQLGAARSSAVTPEQAEIARFAAQVGNNLWNQTARILISRKPLPLAESARMFALVNMAICDAYLSAFEAKYFFNFWRPITAIRNGDTDGNDATERDAGWNPSIDAPAHPEYPCAHCDVHFSAGTVLQSVFGTGTFPEISLTGPGQPRKYTSLQQIMDEIIVVRIWAGDNFRNSNEVGATMGKQVGEYVLQHYYQPTR